jgi:hypothetical protein
MPITCLVGLPLARWSRAYALNLNLFFYLIFLFEKFTRAFLDPFWLPFLLCQKS